MRSNLLSDAHPKEWVASEENRESRIHIYGTWNGRSDDSDHLHPSAKYSTADCCQGIYKRRKGRAVHAARARPRCCLSPRLDWRSMGLPHSDYQFRESWLATSSQESALNRERNLSSSALGKWQMVSRLLGRRSGATRCEIHKSPLWKSLQGTDFSSIARKLLK